MKIAKIVLVVALITFISFLIISPWFLGAYTVNSGSFEPIFLAYASFIKNNFPGFTFNPLWYLGFPNRFAFPPFLFYLMAFISLFWKNPSTGQIYHLLTGFFFLFLPISVLFFLRSLKVSWFPAFLTVILFTFYPSIIYILPSLGKEVSQFLYPPFNLLALAYFGLGPRIVALILTFLALSVFVRYLEISCRKYLLLTAFLSVLVLLTDQVTGIGFLIFALSLFLSKALLGKGFQLLNKIPLLLLLIFGLVAWYYNFSLLTKIYFAPSLGGISFADLFPTLFKLLLLGVPLTLALFSRKFVKKEENLPLTFSVLSLIIFLSLILIYYFENPDYLSEYIRFLPEFNFSFGLLVSLLIVRKVKFNSNIQGLIIFLLLLPPMFFSFKWNRLSLTTYDPSEFREYQLTQKLKEINPQRIYATGAMAFWLNSFFDIPQVRGGADSANLHPWFRDASYYIREGDDSNQTLLWLKALNVTHIVVSGSNSREFYYRDYKNIDRFSKGYEIVFEKDGDRILKVPLSSLSLAQKVSLLEHQKLTPLAGVKDKENLTKYVDWIDTKGIDVPLTFIENNKIVIESNNKENEGISLQMVFDKRWSARDEKGNKLEISADPLGNMFLPLNKGVGQITLSYQESWDVWLGIAITLFTILYIIKICQKK